MAEASSPDGPWTYHDKVVVPTGEPGAWDQYNIHDPQPVVLNGKIYMYYKSDYNKESFHTRSQGVAIADSPFGPFKKSDVKPILNSGHETNTSSGGVGAIATRDGQALHHSVLTDGEFQPSEHLHDDARSIWILRPDAFNNTEMARGIIRVYATSTSTKGSTHSLMFRFDCDLSTEYNDKDMKINHVRPTYDYMKRGLSKQQKQRAIKELRTKEGTALRGRRRGAHLGPTFHDFGLRTLF